MIIFESRFEFHSCYKDMRNIKKIFMQIKLSDLLIMKRLLYTNNYPFTFIFDDIHHLMNSMFGAESDQLFLCISHDDTFAFTFQLLIYALWLNLLSFIEKVRHLIEIRPI